MALGNRAAPAGKLTGFFTRLSQEGACVRVHGTVDGPWTVTWMVRGRSRGAFLRFPSAATFYFAVDEI